MGLRARRFGIAALDGLGGPSYRFPQIVTALSICISQEDDVLPQADVDQDFQQRPAYQEGCLTDQPDLSVYDQMFEEKEEEEDEDDDRPW